MSKKTRVLVIEDEQKWSSVVQDAFSRLNLEGVFLTQESEFVFTDGTPTNGSVNYKEAEVVTVIRDLDVKLVLCDSLLLTADEDPDRRHYQGSDHISEIIKNQLEVQIWSISSDPLAFTKLLPEVKRVLKTETELFKTSLIAELIKWKRENETTKEQESLFTKDEFKIK